MGSCLSKKSANCASCSSIRFTKPSENLKKSESQLEKKKMEEENDVKKEIFIINHRESDEIRLRRRLQQQQSSSANEDNGETEKSGVEKGKTFISSVMEGNGVVGAAPVRTSSCTKEEVDAILIQCGRLSRSSSTGKAASLSSGNGGVRKFSGSKRSYDFDGEDGVGAPGGDDGADEEARERENRPSERRRQSQGRRRTPSRERERDQQQRSGSRERGGGGGRRVSRSPGKRSESPITPVANSNSNSHSSTAGADAGSRPGKLISVPATVSSMAMDKSPNSAGVEHDATTGGAVRRIHVKRNASPRARSPARTNVGPNQQIMSLSRSNSRKAEHSPYRRNPLAEIDTNIVPQKPNTNSKTAQETPGKSSISLDVISPSEPKNPKPQPVSRSRSSSPSHDFDTINPETLTPPLNPNNNKNNTSSYTAILLEDIQNFHQKNHHPPPLAAISLPPCVTKGCSILGAVADLNSTTSSHLSSNMHFPDDFNKTRPKKAKDHPILESEVAAKDDLMELSFHKYFTVRRGASEADTGEEESSGSNSFAASGSQWQMSSSGWEPNSAESTDRWTSSSSCSRSVSRLAGSELGSVGFDDGRKKMESTIGGGIGQGRVGAQSARLAGNVVV